LWSLIVPRFPLFLSLSVVLHLAVGMLLFGRDATSAAMPTVKAAAQPTVVQVSLAPAPVRAQPVAAKPLAAIEEKLPVKVPARQIKPAKPAKPVKPARPAIAVAKAKPPAPPVQAAAVKPAPKATAPQATALAEKTAAQTAQPPAAPAVSATAAATSTSTATATATATAAAETEVEVLSRQPAFRLPPEQPRYPAQARRRNQQGVVLLEVRLDARGAQREIRLLRSSGFPSLDRAALEAVAEWRFHPEVINGRGVPSRVQIPVEFALMASR
jgi:protein TonB